MKTSEFPFTFHSGSVLFQSAAINLPDTHGIPELLCAVEIKTSDRCRQGCYANIHSKIYVCRRKRALFPARKMTNRSQFWRQMDDLIERMRRPFPGPEGEEDRKRKRSSLSSFCFRARSPSSGTIFSRFNFFQFLWKRIGRVRFWDENHFPERDWNWLDLNFSPKWKFIFPFSFQNKNKFVPQQLPRQFNNRRVS